MIQNSTVCFPPSEFFEEHLLDESLFFVCILLIGTVRQVMLCHSEGLFYARLHFSHVVVSLLSFVCPLPHTQIFLCLPFMLAHIPDGATYGTVHVLPTQGSSAALI